MLYTFYQVQIRASVSSVWTVPNGDLSDKDAAKVLCNYWRRLHYLTRIVVCIEVQTDEDILLAVGGLAA